jgi:glycosidase
VDGFRYDMAEMVPVEFWSYMNSAIKNKNPDAFLLAEIYNPSIYRDYINLGKMDFLYDKVDLYDTLKHIIRGNGSTDNLPALLAREADIESRMLHFLENHDEQRIASPEFAGDASKGKPAMVLSATIGSAPVMIYFGQEVGEQGAETGGFGSPSRTSIFDYMGVPHHQRWMNNGKFDGGQLTKEESALRDFYKKLLNFTIHSPALTGNFREIHSVNRQQTKGYSDRVFSYVRWKEKEKLLITCNFDATNSSSINLIIPEEVIKAWNLKEGTFELNDQLYGVKKQLVVSEGMGKVSIELKPLESLILKVGK